MLPPKLEAPLKVTKSPKAAPWFVSVTVTVEEPLVAEKVTSPALVVNRRGVTSLKLSPSWIYNLTLVPTPRSFVPCRLTQPCSSRPVPKYVEEVFLAHPPIFSGRPLRNRTKLPSNQPPSAVYAVPSLSIPGLNNSFCNGINHFNISVAQPAREVVTTVPTINHAPFSQRAA